MGMVILLTAAGLWEVSHDYTDQDVDATTFVGHFDIPVDRDVEPPIWIAYELEGFYQTHRLHKESCSYDQLQDAASTKLALLKEECGTPAMAFKGDDQRILYPCGLLAMRVFNDKYRIHTRGPDRGDQWERLSVDSSPKSISWEPDAAGRFRNLDPEAIDSTTGLPNQVAMNMWILQEFPPVTCEQVEISEALHHVPVAVAMKTVNRTDPVTGQEQQVNISDCTGHTSAQPRCNFTRNGEPFECTGNYREVIQSEWGIETAHFINWIRVAGLPTFRKLWGKVDTPLRAGSTIRVHYLDVYPVKEFYGRKSLVIYTGSALGGSDDLLAYGFIGAGSFCLLFGLASLYWIVTRPRALGDISLLPASQW